ADFNRDGALDVAVAATDRLAVWLADGGRFRRVADTPVKGSDLTVIDFNDDAIPDLVNAGALVLGVGNGTFALIRSTTFQETYVTAAGDVDGDGDTDFAAAGFELRLWRNDGGTLVPEVVGPAPIATDLKIADLDGDGVQELIVLTGDLGSRTILVYRSAATANRLWFALRADLGSYRLATGDFGGDGRKEIAVRANGAVQLYAATPEPHLVGQVTGLPGFEPRFAADFDHDGRDDLLLLREGTKSTTPLFYRNDGAVALLPGRGGFTFGAPVVVAEELAAIDVNIGDFDGDGNRDVAIDVSATTEIAYGDGRGAFQRAAMPYDVRTAYLPFRVMQVADLDGDGRDEILGMYDFGPIVALFLGGRGEAARRVVTIQTALRYAFAVGQVDREGMDIVTFASVLPGLCEPSTHRRPR
ncbi:MAG TPA: VCBS repeat-containing protein, partial [Thermoanaerobaculia bacterium]|nr:VCBS repeat-containing protein [Thermoanaerobaculia bacterium]